MRHVLIVDDEPAICELVRTALEADGSCRVTSAGSAGDAMAVIENDRPDAAIVDAVLPQVSGLQLAGWAIDRGVPVLIVTGEPQTRDRLVDAGCPYLAKPFAIGKLLAEIQALLDEAAQRRADLALLLRQLGAKTAELRMAPEWVRETRARYTGARRTAPRRAMLR